MLFLTIVPKRGQSFLCFDEISLYLCSIITDEWGCKIYKHN